MSGFPVQSGQTFLMIGDSITDHGRRGVDGPYGWGYVRFFMDIVAQKHPERDIQWINKGIGGNTVHDLRARWDEDVTDVAPDWLSIMIGINDARRRIEEPEAGPAITAFRTDYISILDDIQEFRPRLVILDPFYITNESVGADAAQMRMLDRLPGYLDVVEEMVEKTGAIHVLTQEMFQRQLEYRPPAYFCPEPVHPYQTGHLMIALALYDAICSAARWWRMRQERDGLAGHGGGSATNACLHGGGAWDRDMKAVERGEA